jgi:hypothetical protein
VWKQLADKALCKHYEGKALYAGLEQLHGEILREMNETLLREHAKSNEESHEHRRPGRNPSDDEAIQGKKINSNPIYGTLGYCRRFRRGITLPSENSEFEGSKLDPNSGNVSEWQQEPPSQVGRPPPAILTAETSWF